jgi:hypothetical protein
MASLIPRGRGHTFACRFRGGGGGGEVYLESYTEEDLISDVANGTLTGLQTLNLTGCTGLEALPKSMGTLRVVVRDMSSEELTRLMQEHERGHDSKVMWTLRCVRKRRRFG